jgi:2-methylcitrate dehydratase PrpD
MGATEDLCAKVVRDVTYDRLPPGVLSAARGALLDGVGNMLAGSREPLAGVVMRHLLRFAGPPVATVVGHQARLAPTEAAFANGIFCHCLDYELMWYPPTHPTGPVLAAILAVSEIHPVSGRDAITALVAGFEIQGRLSQAIVDTGTRWPNGLHPPGVVGPFGAALSAALLLGLPPAGLQCALGIVGSRLGGLMGNTGTMTKSSHIGHAARMGLEAALLAQDGFTASEQILEGVHGFNDSYFHGELDLAEMVARFADPYRMVTPGLTVKKYPSQYPTHWSIDAALQVHTTAGFTPSAIRSVRVEVGADNEAARTTPPATGLAGKFSIAYTVAIALLDGEVGVEAFRDERLHAPDLQALLARVEIVPMPEVRSMDFAEAWSRVTVTLTDGRELSARVDRPLGIWDNPLPWDGWVRKYLDCATRAVPRQQADRIRDLIEHFDEVADVGRDLVPLLVGAR